MKVNKDYLKFKDLMKNIKKRFYLFKPFKCNKCDNHYIREFAFVRCITGYFKEIYCTNCFPIRASLAEHLVENGEAVKQIVSYDDYYYMERRRRLR